MRAVVHATGTDGQRYALVPMALVQRLPQAARALLDEAGRPAVDDVSPLPPAVALALLQGAGPLRAWREHRGLTLQALADAASVSKAYVSQIESGKRAGTAATLKKLALALGLPLEALLP